MKSQFDDKQIDFVEQLSANLSNRKLKGYGITSQEELLSLAPEEIDLARVLPSQRAERLTTMGVDTLLCGGISGQLTSLIEKGGVQVVPWVAGEVNTVLEEFLTGNVTQTRFAMPGCNQEEGRKRKKGKRLQRHCRRMED